MLPSPPTPLHFESSCGLDCTVLAKFIQITQVVLKDKVKLSFIGMIQHVYVNNAIAKLGTITTEADYNDNKPIAKQVS